MNILVHWAQENPKTAISVFLSTLLMGTVLEFGKKAVKATFKFFCPHKIISDDETLQTIVNYLKANGRSYGVSDEDTIGFKKTITPEKGTSFVKFLFGIQIRFSYRLFILKGVPILLLPTILSNDDSRKYSTIIYLRGSLNWKDFLTQAALHFDDQNSTEGKRFSVTLYGKGGKSSQLSTKTKEYDNSDQIILINDIDVKLAEIDRSSRLDKLSLTASMKKVIKNFEFWLKNEQWYRKTGVPWKRGYLLYGPPGTGKSSLIRAMAEHYDIPVNIFDLASMDSDDLNAAWADAKEDGLRFCVFEDFDTVFNGRDVAKEGIKLNFNAVLNIMDGISKEEGLVVFITTNHIENIDPAMGVPDNDGNSTRPGRVDMVAKIDMLNEDGKIKMAKRILGDELLAHKICLEYPSVTGADFQERCAQLAIQQLWGQFSDE